MIEKFFKCKRLKMAGQVNYTFLIGFYPCPRVNKIISFNLKMMICKTYNIVRNVSHGKRGWGGKCRQGYDGAG